MTDMVFLRRLLQAMQARWSVISEVNVGKTKTESRIENILHDLCHAEVFGISPRRNLVDQIGARFEYTQGHRVAYFVNPRASDLSECRTIAVELWAAEELGVRLDKIGLLESAIEGMRLHEFRTPQGTGRAVEKFLQQPVTRRRAQAVAARLRKLVKQEGEIGS